METARYTTPVTTQVDSSLIVTEDHFATTSKRAQKSLIYGNILLLFISFRYPALFFDYF